MTVDLLVAGDMLVATLSGAMAIYQLWMASRHKGTFLWAGMMSVGAVLYALASGLNLGLASATWSRPLMVLSYTGLLLLVHSGPPFAAAVVREPLVRWWRFGVTSMATWFLVLATTGWVIGWDVIPTHLTLLDHPFLRPSSGVLAPVFFAYAMGVAGVAATWLFRHRAGAEKTAIGFFVALVIWLAVGVVDSMTAMGVFANPPMYFIQYVYLLFACVLFGRSATEHAALLDAQRRLTGLGEQSFQALVQRSPEMVVVHQDGAVVYANDSAVRLLGYASLAELVGLPVLPMVHPDDVAAVRERVRTMVAGDFAPARRERFCRRDGSFISVEVVGMLTVFNAEPAIVVIGRDLTELLREERRRMQVDRMVAVGTLAAGVAHEINNPLTVLLGNLELLGDDVRVIGATASDAQQQTVRAMRTSLADAVEGGERVATVVHDLALVSSGQEEGRGPVDLKAVLQTTARLASNELRNRAPLALSVGDLPPVHGDAGRLGQVFLNLLVNAAQAIPYGEVSAHHVSVSAHRDEGHVVVEVRDDGEGIAPENLTAIFDAFYTTKGPGQGTGLGLAISRQIINDHDGQLTVDSVRGLGTSFFVRLPIAEVGDVEPVASTVPTTPVPMTPPRVTADPRRPVGTLPTLLLIDDEDGIRRALSRTLSKHWRCVSVASVAEAVALLERGDLPQAILCDLLMPEQTGWDLHAQLTASWPDLVHRTVFMTGGVLDDQCEGFLQRPDVRAVRKPPTSAALDAALAHALD